MTVTTTELLAEEGRRTASIEEYVEAAKLLTRVRLYRERIAEIAEVESDPGFRLSWEGMGLFEGHDAYAALCTVDAQAGELNTLLAKLDDALADPLWQNVESIVRGAARALRRPERGTTLCVPDFAGRWIIKGDGYMVAGTASELDRAAQRWTALRDILPPPRPVRADS